MTFSDLYYLDSELYASFQYGFTRSLTVGFYFPYRYRLSGGDETIQSWGIGDIEFNATYQLYQSPKKHAENAVAFSTKFPSGNTRALNDSGSLELPLGNGQYEWTAGLHNRLHIGDKTHITFDADYRYRIPAVAEYLVVTLIDETYQLDIANSTIDFGDQLTGVAGVQFDLFDFLTIGSQFWGIYQFKTTIDETPMSSSDGYIIYAVPSIQFHVSDDILLHIESSVPLYGWRYPVVSLADVVSLVPKYGLQLGFELRFK